ncbi:MAG: cytochrome P450 [Spongiibacteraceae bacterium]
MSESTPITFTDTAMLRCPFAAYKQLRDEQPVYRDPVTGMYILTRYEDVKAAAANPGLFSNITTQLGHRESPVKTEIDRLHAEADLMPVRTMVDNDPPDHTQYRKLVDWAFRVSRINAIGDYIENLAHEFVDKFIANGHVDIVSELAVPLPVLVIADQLGVDRSRLADIKRWSDALIFSADINLSPERHREIGFELLEMRKYLASKVEEMRAAPRDNIISDIANAQIDGQPATIAQIVSTLTGLLVAGNETTTSTIALGTEYLIESGLEDELRANPDKIPNFVEEALRLATPLQALFRRATADTEVGGVTIPKDATVMLRWGAANRDERRFENPDQIVLDRRGINQHVAFGFGTHFCVGNALARAELRTVFRVLLSRVKNLRLAGEPELVVHSFARGLSKLPITFERI